jgi:hypothetical protein
MHHANRVLPRVPLREIPAGSQVTVTIGRNGDNLRGMPLGEWHDFQSIVTGVLRDQLTPTAEFGPFEGSGVWEGVVEDSAVLIVLAGRPGSVVTLANALTRVAREFGQDAIAWTFGPNLLSHSTGATTRQYAHGEPEIVTVDPV